MNPDLYKYVARLIVLFTALPVHECAHAFVSDKLGDHTARDAGRLTLNPIKHIDPLGLLSMLIIGIGWAKPVPVNPGYYENQKRGMALSAAAGPLSNLLLGFAMMIVYKFFAYGFYVSLHPAGTLLTVYDAVAGVLFYLVLININLAIFNLIPVPPFDGSRILGLVLPEKLYFSLMKYERYTGLVVLALVFFGLFDGILSAANGYVYAAINWATGWIDLIFSAALG